MLPWKRLDSRYSGDYRIFRMRQDRYQSPRSNQEHTFHIIEAGDWVNIIPITAEGQVVCIRQYRHGVEQVTLEVPGGMIDPGESAATAARREMQEETGYDASEIVYLGQVAPNPAILNNACHSFLALDARLNGLQRLDGAEDIEVVLVDLPEIPSRIIQGDISHALVVAAFYLFDQYRLGHTPA